MVDSQAALSRGEAVQGDAGELVDGDDGLHDYAGSGALTHLTKPGITYIVSLPSCLFCHICKCPALQTGF